MLWKAWALLGRKSPIPASSSSPGRAGPPIMPSSSATAASSSFRSFLFTGVPVNRIYDAVDEAHEIPEYWNRRSSLTTIRWSSTHCSTVSVKCLPVLFNPLRAMQISRAGARLPRGRSRPAQQSYHHSCRRVIGGGPKTAPALAIGDGPARDEAPLPPPTCPGRRSIPTIAWCRPAPSPGADACAADARCDALHLRAARRAACSRAARPPPPSLSAC